MIARVVAEENARALRAAMASIQIHSKETVARATSIYQIS